MDNKQVTAEWIAQQRQISEIVNMTYEDAPGSVVPLLKQIEKSQTADLDALEAAYAEIASLTAERDAAVRDWQQAAEGSGSFDSCGACTHRKYDNTDGIYCDIKACHPEWRGPEPGKEGKPNA